MTVTSEDAPAATYYRALLLNTLVADSTWDEELGSYPISNASFCNVLGNAVLLRYGTYDEGLAGISQDELRDHTLRTISACAAKSRCVTLGGSWGRVIYWDSGLAAYFTGGAKLLWRELDGQTQDNVDAIIRGEANYVVGIGAGDDGSGTTNGLLGGYQGDTKMEEMGNRSMPLAAALAWLPADPWSASWDEWLHLWLLNMNGLPAADQANPTVVGGRSISTWTTAQNLWDTFITENHGCYSPIYQQSAGAYPGRNAFQFLLAGRPLPPVLTKLPNADALWETMARTGTDAGVPEDLMIDDRHHLYGRNLLPIAYRAMVAGDPHAAAAEAMLARRLLPYVAYPPAGRLTKFSGEPKYEPEARAELAMAYLLHRWRGRLGGGPEPVSPDRYFAWASGARDYGPGPGLVAHQSPRALAAAVTKPEYVKFAYLPQHDDWLFKASGASASFLPSTALELTGRAAIVYERVRDGFDGSATVISTTKGVAGFTTLPDGSAVYATTGLDDDDGRLAIYNLSMPGVEGLRGARTFTWQGGSVTLSAHAGSADGGVDELTLVQGSWLNVDGRAGFVVRGSSNPIAVGFDKVRLSAGPAVGATGMVVEAYPAETPARTADHARAPAPASVAPLVASLVGGHLSLVNLGRAPIAGAWLDLPKGREVQLFQGTQVSASGSTRYLVELAGASAAIAWARFAVDSPNGELPESISFTVVDSHSVRVAAPPQGAPPAVRLRSLTTGEQVDLVVPAGQEVTAGFAMGPVVPTTDLARARTTFPTSPLPPGMTSPALAVNGDPGTAWQPGKDGRMIVDLGAVRTLDRVTLDWTGPAPGVNLAISDDGLAYTELGAGPEGGLVQEVAASTSGRYVAVTVRGAARAGLRELRIVGP